MSKVCFFISVIVMLVVSCGIKNSTGNGTKKDSQSPNGKTIENYDYRSVLKNAEFTFVLNHTGPLDGYTQKGVVLLKSFVEANSNGRIGIQIYPNGQLASTVDQRIDGLMEGAIDITHTTGDVSAYWEPMSVFDLPYMLKDDRLAEAVFSDPEFVQELRDAALRAMNNVRLVIITNSGRWRNFATTKKKILTVDDIQGLKFRTIASTVQQQLVKALGGSPTGIPWGETYLALSTGIVDGTKNGITDIINAKLYESVKFIVLDGHAYMAGFWWINNKKFKSLPRDLQQIMVDGFDAMSWFIREYNKYAEASSILTFMEAGGSIYKPSDEELAAFKSAAQSVETWFVKNASQETKTWLTNYKRVIKQHQERLRAIRAMEIY